METLRRHGEHDRDKGRWTPDPRLGLLSSLSWEAREACCTESCRLARALGGGSDTALMFVGLRGHCLTSSGLHWGRLGHSCAWLPGGTAPAHSWLYNFTRSFPKGRAEAFELVCLDECPDYVLRFILMYV